MMTIRFITMHRLIGLHIDLDKLADPCSTGDFTVGILTYADGSYLFQVEFEGEVIARTELEDHFEIDYDAVDLARVDEVEEVIERLNQRLAEIEEQQHENQTHSGEVSL